MPSASTNRPHEDEPFPLRHASDVPARPAEAQWLVEPLWSAEGAGLVAAPPKSLKTWMAAELGVAVAAGDKALGRFPARRTGPVVMFTAEDPPEDMRPRLDGICHARGVRLREIPLFHLDIPELRLDRHVDLRRLRRTLESLRPCLVILDPFVRLVGDVDENSAGEVAAVLGALRAIQRDYHVAILLVHHMRKAPSSSPGQQLRGSSDFGAWLDSAIYLIRRGEDLHVTVEHRRAAAPPSFRVRLEATDAPHLVLVEAEAPEDAQAPEARDSLEAAVLAVLRQSRRPILAEELRRTLHVRKASLQAALRALSSVGLIVRGGYGWAEAKAEGSES